MMAVPLKQPVMENQRQSGAVEKARKIFDLAAELPRKEAINLAVSVAGLKRSTAQTQYQHWKKKREEQNHSQQ